jgi:hypothetical protein
LDLIRVFDGGMEKYYNEELHGLYSSLDIQVREDEMVGACSMHGELRNANRIFVGKVEGKRPLERPRCSWEDNIKLFRDIEFGDMDWIHQV